MSGNGNKNTDETPKELSAYLKFIDDVPSSVSRSISQLHEKQISYSQSLDKFENMLEKLLDSDDDEEVSPEDVKNLLLTQKYLTGIQDSSDAKLSIVQQLLEYIDTQELDHVYRQKPAPVVQQSSSKTKEATSSGTSKQTAKQQHQQQQHQQQQAQQQQHQKDDDDNDNDESEPTYCVCHQISFGDMICCDNDDCEIQWYHFQCVSLTFKPKGKWYCPSCRGDRSNQLKK